MKYQFELERIFGVAIIEAAKAHARQEFPRESCGFITSDAYVPCENKAADPLQDFMIEEPAYDQAVIAGQVRAIVHSHPNGPQFPTALDMRSQIGTAVPWLIVNLNDTDIAGITAWGAWLPIVPLLARPFLHGVLDCYALVRDVFRLGKDELAKQGIGWPYDPILLPEVPRDDKWWTTEQDLYQDHLAKEGFVVIPKSEARSGDGFLIRIGDASINPLKKLNHAGVLVDHDKILHHLPTRQSQREPAGLWARHADLWVRYEGKPS